MVRGPFGSLFGGSRRGGRHRDSDANAARRRVLGYVAVALALMIVYTVLYRWGMATFESRQLGYLESMVVVVETMTTTGFGEDAGVWSTPFMWGLTIVMMLSGVGLIFLALPVFLVPLVEDALRTDPPTATEQSDHVIICTYTSRGETLVQELDSIDVPYVIVDPDRDTAVKLHERGYDVVHGDPESVSDLEAANATSARALVADSDDETNASIILSARETAPELRVVSLVEDSAVADYHRYAGADRVVSPRRLLGESLASKATTSISTELGGAIEVGEDFEIVELLVQRGSPLVGRTIAESEIGERTGANIIGAWFRGEFVSPPSPSAVIDENTVLLVSGREAQLERLKGLTLSETRDIRRGQVVVAGYGIVGMTAHEQLVSADMPNVVVDEVEKPGVDVVGDATEQRTLQKADLPASRTVILALDDDRTAIFATLAIKQVAPGAEVIARANEPENISKLYRAGAEYVLSLATVSGRMLASTLLNEEVIAPDTQVEVVRTEAPALVGHSLAEVDVRARTGCTVIAAERNGQLVTDVGPKFVVQPQDVLVVAGIDDDVNRFNKLADVEPA
jgi:Trk K+ transport system NAD-binding subunit